VFAKKKQNGDVILGLFNYNGSASQTIVFTPTGSFSTPGTVTAYLPLSAGSNTVEFSDASAYAPDLNGITVSQ
jgi:hypothetical protein